MTALTGPERSGYVRDLFARIAPRYDLLNRLMTGGQDLRWRRQVVRLAGLRPGDRLLDLGAGTGDLAREALRQQPRALVTAADFTLEMMRAGRDHAGLSWSAADALHLPFPDESFDAVVSGFLMRNVADLDRALREQCRALKPAGRVVILDTTRPLRNLFSPLVWVHLHLVIPLLGRLLAGSGEDYRYLTASTEGFLSAEELAARMLQAGFRQVRFQRLMLGTIAIHYGEK